MYRIKNDKGEVVDYGVINGARPKESYFRTDPNLMDNALKCRDIRGNQPGSATAGAFHTAERREFRTTGKNDDIEGTNTGSLVTGIKVPTFIE